MRKKQPEFKDISFKDADALHKIAYDAYMNQEEDSDETPEADALLHAEGQIQYSRSRERLMIKPDFKDGDRVIYAESGLHPEIHGTIIGISTVNVVDFWIVLADDPKKLAHPYRAFVAPHVLLHREA